MRIGEDSLSDALGEMRHKIRLLTMAIVGLVESPHDVQDSYHQSRPERHRDRNRAHDVKNMAFDVASDFDKLVEAFDDDDRARKVQS